jgi:hypothetical protein
MVKFIIGAILPIPAAKVSVSSRAGSQAAHRDAAGAADCAKAR